MTIQDLRDRGLIVYEYIRGSQLHGIATPTSDTDYGGVYIAPKEVIHGLRGAYQDTISDSKGDTVFYELSFWMSLLAKSNPNALESLFVPEEFVVYKDPCMDPILSQARFFLSKDAFPRMLGYSYSQIAKARGLNKKIVNPVEKKGVLDFCFVFTEQGSTPITKLLKKNGLKQEYCGLVNVPNMRDAYAIFYDWGNHYLHEKTGEGGNTMIDYDFYDFVDYEMNRSGYRPEFTYVHDFLRAQDPIGYKGIVSQAEIDTVSKSNDIRLSSVPKGARPICHMTFNRDGYQSYCREYKEYKDWEADRNPVRYESNLEKNYDAKNVTECIRLLHMGIELAQTSNYNIVRPESDRKFLLDIKAHKYEYDDIISYAEGKRKLMEEAVAATTLKEHVDAKVVNELCCSVRENFYERQAYNN